MADAECEIGEDLHLHFIDLHLIIYIRQKTGGYCVQTKRMICLGQTHGLYVVDRRSVQSKQTVCFLSLF